MTKVDLRHEDCTKGMSRLKDESVDLVVTSPPYNLGIKYSRYVRRYGLGLRPDLYEDQPILRTHDEGQTYEAYLASRLRAQGYAVKGGH